MRSRGTPSTARHGRVSNPLVPGLGIWFVLFTPIIGGLMFGPLVSRFAPEARGHGVPEVMLAVNRLGGRIRPQVPIVKSLASALCIGSGGSVGREGPIVQIGSALGSVLGQLARVSESSSAPARRVRRGRGDIGDVQRADRRSVLRARADPAQLRRRVVRATSYSALSLPTQSGAPRLDRSRS